MNNLINFLIISMIRLNTLDQLLKKKNIKLIIIDSVAALIRHELIDANRNDYLLTEAKLLK
jgi:RecA/RadA recombinase